MPYSINERTYAANSDFYLLPPRPLPTFRHEILRKYWVGWRYERYQHVRAHPLGLARKLVEALREGFGVSPLLVFFILIAVALGPTPHVRVALTIAGVLGLGVLMEITVRPHYYAPAAGLLVVLVMSGVRSLAALDRERRATGRFIVLLFAIAFLIPYAFRVVDRVQHPWEPNFTRQRREIITRLMHEGSRHLVIVHYAPDHPFELEWVFNRADIDNSDIVWARDMGEARNRELLDYYPNRSVWLLSADTTPAGLTAYP
jgi:hypothetical protein